MLEALKFVAGSVARKDYVPELTHFKIRGGWVQAFNGTISAASRIDMDIDVMPWAVEMINAVKACDETMAMSITPTGRLAIKSGKFKVFVNCLDMNDAALQTFPTPEGDIIPVTSGFMTMLRTLQPFMADDASRPWAMGIMFEENSAFATNNVMLAQYWHGFPFKHRVTIPAEAVNEIVKQKAEPTAVQATDNSLTIWFGNDRWIRTQLLEDQFPEQIYKVIDAPGEPFVAMDTFPGFFAALDTLKPFVDGDLPRVYFHDGALSTAGEHQGEEVGATVEVPNISGGRCYNWKHLNLLRNIVAAVDFSGYPAPSRFVGTDRRLRGVFVGIGVNAG